MLFFRQLITAEKLSFLHRCYSQSGLNFSDPAIQTYLKKLMFEHDNLNSKTKKTFEESKRLFEMKPIVNVLVQRMYILHDCVDALKDLQRQQGEDHVVNKMIKEEALIYFKRVREVDGDLWSILLEPQLTDGGILLEIAAGTGGEEAMLFARELFEMYESYAKYKDWDVDIASLERSDVGGYKNASMLLGGVGVLEMMKMEDGVHRVQRVPNTEKEGRIFTGTVTVTILPQPFDHEIHVSDQDIVFENKQVIIGSDQHANSTVSDIRMVHTPTGTVVECQGCRSQTKNKEIAMQKLRTLLLEKQQQKKTSEVSGNSLSNFLSRNTKIRTYNYPLDRVTEHREGGGVVHSLEEFMAGAEALENMQDRLLRQAKHQELLDEINQFVDKGAKPLN